MPFLAVHADPPQPFTEHFFELARTKVLKKYVGNERVINEIFNQMKPWYLYPETRQKPLVISLWGMTGTGKSSIIRNLLDALALNRDARYFDMDRFSAESPGSMLGFQAELCQSYIRKQNKGPSILLDVVEVPNHPILILDEFQKISTRLGIKEINRPNAQGVWELLGNDGTIVIDNPAHFDLKGLAFNTNSYVPVPERLHNKRDEINAYIEGVREQARTLFESEPAQVNVDLRGALVFVAGNLDHVFPGATLFSSESITADQLHQLTSSISPSDIKEGLGRIYRPEHVGRLGNRHIVVPTLSETQFRAYIEMRLNEITRDAELLGIKISFSDNFKRRIYREGVVPAQGIRPLRAVVDNFALDPLGEIYSLVKSYPEYNPNNRAIIEVDVKYKAQKAVWHFINGTLIGQAREIAIPSEYSQSLSPHPEPLRSLTSVHQAGTATVWIHINKKVPNAVYARSRSNGRFGYIESPNEAEGSIRLRSELVNQIAIEIAGFVAEEMIFGEVTMASEEKLRRASVSVAEMLTAGLGNTAQPWLLHPQLIPRNSKDIESEAGAIVKEAKSHAREILEKERIFFRALTKVLHKIVWSNQKALNHLVRRHWSDSSAKSIILSGGPPKSVCQTTAEAFITDSNFIFKKPTPSKTQLGF